MHKNIVIWVSLNLKYKLLVFANTNSVICKIIVGNGLCAVPHCKTKRNDTQVVPYRKRRKKFETT